MIQRIQSVYLLLVTILLVVTICMPVGQFIGTDGVTAHVFKPLGVSLAGGGFLSTWGLFGILLLSVLVAFCTIFLFRNRMLQIRMTIFSSILLIGYYIAFCVFMFILKDNLDAMTFQLGWALCLPVVAIILNYLAGSAPLPSGFHRSVSGRKHSSPGCPQTRSDSRGLCLRSFSHTGTHRPP